MLLIPLQSLAKVQTEQERELSSLIKKVSLALGSDNPERVDYIINNESQYDPTQIGDMNLICPIGPNKGKPVRARGWFQITECYHPEVSDAQAFDYIWALKWSIPKINNEKTCKIEWTACRWHYDGKDIAKN